MTLYRNRRDKLDVLLSASLRRYEFGELTEFLNADTSDVIPGERYRRKRAAVLERFRDRPIRSPLKRLTSAAAVVLVTVLSAALITVMSVSALREAVLEAVVEFYDKYIAVLFVSSEGETETEGDTEEIGESGEPERTAAAPAAEILEYRSPVYRPEGVEAQVKTELPERYYIDYYKDDILQYSFCQQPIGDEPEAFDRSDVTVTTQEVSGHSGVLLTYENGYSLLWDDEEYVYRLDSYLSLDQTMRLAESVGESELSPLPTAGETEVPVTETDPPAVETEVPVTETDPPAVETDPAVTETTPPVSSLPSAIAEYRRPTYLSAFENVAVLSKTDNKYSLVAYAPGSKNYWRIEYEYAQTPSDGGLSFLDKSYVSQILDVGGSKCAVIEHSGYVSLLWDDGTYSYSLNCYLGLDTAVRLAESVKAAELPPASGAVSIDRRAPSYLPDGVSENFSVVSGSHSYDVIYYEEDPSAASGVRTVKYFYTQMRSDGDRSYLTQDYVRELVSVNEHEGAIIQFTEGRIFLVWDDGTYRYILDSCMDRATTMKLAESVRSISDDPTSPMPAPTTSGSQLDLTGVEEEEEE